MIKLLPDSLNRYRHNRGFGVHSPLAFKLITGVIHERARYYSYDNIEALFGRREATMAKRIFRLMLFWRPERVAIIDSDAGRADRWRAVVKFALGDAFEPDIRIINDSSTFDTTGYGFVIVDSRVKLDVAIDTMAVQVVKAKKVWRATMATLHDGLVINAGARGLIVRRRNLPLQVIVI